MGHEKFMSWISLGPLAGLAGTGTTRSVAAAVSLFFYFHFLQKYIFVFEIYKNIPWPSSCRAAGTWSPSCRAAGAFLQKFSWNICAWPLEDRPPGSRAAGSSDRPAAGRPPPPPLYKGLAATPPLYKDSWRVYDEHASATQVLDHST